VLTNNLFNGKSSSSVSANRFVLNTGENFSAGGKIQTSTSVYSAIGQALPSPPQETIEDNPAHLGKPALPANGPASNVLNLDESK